jgi:aminotransferase
MVGGKPAGSWGTLAIFSFGSTKYLTAGAGGMVLTDDGALAARIGDLLKLDGRDPALWRHGMPAALPGRLADLNAALANAQLDRLDEFLRRRLAIASVYNSALKGIAGLQLPEGFVGHSYYRYLCRTDAPSQQVAADLYEQGIDARTAVNPWLDDALAARGVGPVGPEMRGAAWWREHLLSLPIYPGMRTADAEAVAEAAGDSLRVKT